MSGLIVDIALVFMVLEGGLLSLYWVARRRGVAPLNLFTILLSGLPLLLAVRLVVGGAPWGWVALCLTAALVAHLLDLKRRWSP